MPLHAALSPADAQSPHSRATPAWSAGSTLWPVRPPEGEERRITPESLAWKALWLLCNDAGRDKPPFFQLPTFQTDNGRAGKATPLYAVRPPRRQSRPDGAAPSPRRSENSQIMSKSSANSLIIL